jgi:hypothetical protein
MRKHMVTLLLQRLRQKKSSFLQLPAYKPADTDGGHYKNEK